MSYSVDDKKIAEIFENEIWPDLTINQPQSQETPHLYVLGDKFIKYHPNFNEIEQE